MKKLTTKLLISVIAVVLALTTLGTSTFAWFSMNTTVTSSGMQVKAKASGSLIIGTTSATNTATSYPIRNNGNVTAAFTASATSLYDCTHSDAASFTSGLKTLDSESRKKASISDGTVTSPTYVEIGTTGYSNSDYFIDYTLYVASSTDASLSLSSLKIKFVNQTSDAAFKNAVAIDWYLGSVSQANFKKTTHIGDSGEIELLGSSDTIVVPAAAETTGTAACSYAIIMRIYIDGAVTGTNGVSNSNYSTANISFDVEITGA